MKVIAFNGSPRKDGNTSLLIKEVFTELEKEGIETELIQLGGHPIHGCIACMKCGKNKNSQCALSGDSLNDHFAKMVAADGIILGSPVYFTDVTTEMKALIDRTGFVARQGNRQYGVQRVDGQLEELSRLRRLTHYHPAGETASIPARRRARRAPRRV